MLDFITLTPAELPLAWFLAKCFWGLAIFSIIGWIIEEVLS